MAEENEDQWLYGDSNLEAAEENSEEKKDEPKEDAPQEQQAPVEDPTQIETSEPPENEEIAPEPETNDKPPDEPETNGESNPPENATEENENQENEEKEDDSDDDDSDDDINVVINDIKTSPAYPSLNIKRGNLIQTTGTGDKSKSQPGKFSIDEFETVGSINGVPAQEFNLDSLEDKPWRKPGADITDYFNYGFNEDTWRAYCERQKRMRVHESGAGLLPMNPGSYTGPRKAGPPPGRRMMGSIDVIGGNSGLASRRTIEQIKAIPPKMSVIPVMTADRREYSRKPPNAGFPDVSVPPPGGPGGFDSNFNSYPEYFDGGYGDYHNFEPTQEQQWGNDPSWAPNDIKQLTPGPQPIQPINNMGMMQGMPPNMNMPPQMVPPPLLSGQSMRDSNNSPSMMDSHSQDSYKREREGKESSMMRDHRDRERESRSRFEKDRHRERSHRRERSRSRSRRHKSRSRSPSHRSQHKKKKSKRHDKSDSD